MKTFSVPALAALLPALIGASPTARQSTETFSLIAIHSGNQNVHNRPINANGGLFWIGKPTTSFCPDSPEISSCPPGNVTAFTGTVGNPRISTSHLVPGEQSIYIQGITADTQGALTFNPAHGSPPTGSVTDQFILSETNLDYTFAEWLACPALGAYYITITEDSEFCIPVNLHRVAYDGPTPAAWQYV